MAPENTDPSANLDIPEGYTVESLKDGRLAVYAASTGAWLGYFSPALSNAQEVAQELIDAHEEEEQHQRALSALAVAVEPLSSPLAAERIAGYEDELAAEIPEKLRPTVVDTTATARADALRVRELEIVAGLAITALREAGNEASAEVVRQVLEHRPE